MRVLAFHWSGGRTLLGASTAGERGRDCALVCKVIAHFACDVAVHPEQTHGVADDWRVKTKVMHVLHLKHEWVLHQPQYEPPIKNSQQFSEQSTIAN
eukprot:2499898-Amphidinium_carterae.1